MVFPVVRYECESWTIKKAENWKIDAFELWCWRRHLKVLWTARRSNQSILKEINPEYSLEYWSWNANILATNSLEKTLMLGKTEGREEEKGMTEDEKVGWHHWLKEHKFEQALGDGEGRGSLACCYPWVAKSRTHLNDWATKYCVCICIYTVYIIYKYIVYIYIYICCGYVCIYIHT